MANVDPFVIKWPAKWVEDPELRQVLFYLNRFLHDLWLRTGGGPDFIEEIQEAITNITIESSHSLQAQINAINERLGSGDALTSDETGFTVDLDTLSVDMTEA